MTAPPVWGTTGRCFGIVRYCKAARADIERGAQLYDEFCSNPVSGEKVWQWETYDVMNSGILTTATDLLFVFGLRD